MSVSQTNPPSGPTGSFGGPVNDEAQYREVDVAMLYIEEARRRVESGAGALARMDADAHLVEAMGRAQAELSEVARTLRQGTFFAVPSAQTSF